MSGDIIMAKKRNKIQYGRVNVLPAKIEAKDENVRISIVMEGDLLDDLKSKAKELGRPYQTLMKEILRQNLQIEKPNNFDFAMLMQKVQEISVKTDLVLETEKRILAKRV